MREGVVRLNADHRDLLSNDFGAVAGLLFDVGTGRYPAPPRSGDSAAQAVWEADLAKVARLRGLRRGQRPPTPRRKRALGGRLC